MIVIFDFDYTLFDTANFRKNFAHVLGLSVEEFNKNYYKHFKLKGLNYNLKKHLVILKRELKDKFKDSTQKRVTEFLENINKFLFPGVRKELTRLKRNKHELILLTYGDIEWQKEKIKRVKIKKYFDKIIFVDKDKRHVLGFLKKKEKDVFIVNDNAKEMVGIKKILKNCQICLVKSKHSNNIEHDLRPRTLDYYFKRII